MAKNKGMGKPMSEPTPSELVQQARRKPGPAATGRTTALLATRIDPAVIEKLRAHCRRTKETMREVLEDGILWRIGKKG